MGRSFFGRRIDILTPPTVALDCSLCGVLEVDLKLTRGLETSLLRWKRVHEKSKPKNTSQKHKRR